MQDQLNSKLEGFSNLIIKDSFENLDTEKQTIKLGAKISSGNQTSVQKMQSLPISETEGSGLGI
jgi:hypothetical protein